MYRAYKLKNEISIVSEIISFWFSVLTISSNELPGRKPPDDIMVKDKLKLSNILKSKIYNKIKIKNVKNV